MPTTLAKLTGSPLTTNASTKKPGLPHQQSSASRTFGISLPPRLATDISLYFPTTARIGQRTPPCKMSHNWTSVRLAVANPPRNHIHCPSWASRQRHASSQQ
ncbi:hypothetical protein PGTUg99_008238 [Puccinia graminis f. sp. tritici]|uniref:Uncharacterized protein n=1 Tax=Puccinia graminis f. sp. tritici TaxID=56615 RepID=A0A5B0S9I4_PUCGR|nr:hypothetical protein PGTUg99_008238 [Puccinia graminis f. sp. tritici]